MGNDSKVSTPSLKVAIPSYLARANHDVLRPARKESGRLNTWESGVRSPESGGRAKTIDRRQVEETVEDTDNWNVSAV
jgi:hypothetical protein